MHPFPAGGFKRRLIQPPFFVPWVPPMEKRVVFGHKTLPYLLLLPQIIITVVFFFLPAGQAMWQSMRLEDAFGR